MKLDPRIEKDTLIYTPFSLDGTNEMIAVHDKGYFSDDIRDFSDLKSCVHGELVELASLSDTPYACKVKSSDKIFYSFYIPECNLKPVEKKYRPYTIEEFLNEGFEILNEGFEIIVFREKSNPLAEYHVRYNGYKKYDSIYKVILGNISYTFDDLFEDFERFYNGRWFPFGVKEE